MEVATIKSVEDTQKLMDLILSRKGQYVRMVTKRPMKVRKGQQAVYKTSTFTARLGVNYDNIKEVKERRADGRAPEVNQGLPWGEWLIPNFIITHKGSYYLRYTTTNNSKAEVEYSLDNGTISAEVAKTMCLASEFPAPKIATIVVETPEGATTTADVEVKTVVYNVNFENIVSIV